MPWSSVEHVVRLDPRGAERRYRPENARRQECDSRGEDHDPPVEREIQRDLMVRRRQLSHERLAAPLSDDEAADGTEHRVNEALEQQLPRETATGRAKRQANAELVPARRGTGQQQVGDVDAGDQQHERDDNQQGDQRPLEPLAQSRRTVGNRLELEGIVQELWLRGRRHGRGAHLRLAFRTSLSADATQSLKPGARATVCDVGRTSRLRDVVRRRLRDRNRMPVAARATRCCKNLRIG